MDVDVPEIPAVVRRLPGALARVHRRSPSAAAMEAGRRRCGHPTILTTWRSCGLGCGPSTTPGYVADQFGTGVGRHRPLRDRRVLREELGRSGIPSVLGNPLVAGAIAQYGTDEQKETFLPRIANGEHIWTQLFSEPDAGSDLTSLNTRGELARRSLRRERAEGVEHVGAVRRLRLPARPHRAGRAARRGITAFILDMRTPGRHDPAVARDHRHDRLQRGVPRRGRGSGREHDRRARGRLAGRGREPRAGARRRRRGRQWGSDRAAR